MTLDAQKPAAFNYATLILRWMVFSCTKCTWKIAHPNMSADGKNNYGISTIDRLINVLCFNPIKAGRFLGGHELGWSLCNMHPSLV